MALAPSCARCSASAQRCREPGSRVAVTTSASPEAEASSFLLAAHSKGLLVLAPPTSIAFHSVVRLAASAIASFCNPEKVENRRVPFGSATPSHLSCPDGTRRPKLVSLKAFKGERRSADILSETYLSDFPHPSLGFESFLCSSGSPLQSPHHQRRLLCPTNPLTVAKYWTISALSLACSMNSALATSSIKPPNKTRKCET